MLYLLMCLINLFLVLGRSLVKYSKEITICNLLLDTNNTLMEKGFLEAYKNFGFPADSWQRRQAMVYKDIIIVHLRIMPPEMDLHDVKYTILDKFANFGGNYGIFAEITGCSFLPLLNLFIILFKLLISCGRN